MKLLSTPIGAHHARAAPLLEATCGAIPMFSASFPYGLGTKAHYYAKGLTLVPPVFEWCVVTLDAVEFHSWTPSPTHKDRLGFARILLEYAGTPNAALMREAARLTREALNAIALDAIGPAFLDEMELTAELKTHGVSAWTVDDLTALLCGAKAYELRPCFERGYAADGIANLLWNREHGMSKRLRVVAELICQVRPALQTTAAREGSPADAHSLQSTPRWPSPIKRSRSKAHRKAAPAKRFNSRLSI